VTGVGVLVIVVVGMAIVAGLFGVWMAVERASRQRIERRREASTWQDGVLPNAQRRRPTMGG
jgi:hypothetical protein